MSPASPALSLGSSSVPRMRGDEPALIDLHTVWAHVFPACAGMSPLGWPAAYLKKGVPRMRGDEPSACSLSRPLVSCSPHARG